MLLFRKIIDWFKYNRLHHYPELAKFDPPEAMKRLKLYEREERDRCSGWLHALWVANVLCAIAFCVLSAKYWILRPLIGFVNIPIVAANYIIFRGVRRRVAAKVAAELVDGRFWTCLECGYDLRASSDRCPECGASVRISPNAFDKN